MYPIEYEFCGTNIIPNTNKLWPVHRAVIRLGKRSGDGDRGGGAFEAQAHGRVAAQEGYRDGSRGARDGHATGGEGIHGDADKDRGHDTLRPGSGRDSVCRRLR